ncbi:MAG: DUF1549 domain-containing protein [Acidobacteria bacterium]|nr:DUF1549 domain-containing protein [Acidobacteriota bacterium]
MVLKGHGDGSSRGSKRNWPVALTKKLAVLAFVLVGLILALDRFGVLDTFGQKSPRRIFRQTTQPTVNADDCSYVKSPMDYQDVAARHRNQVSQLTEIVAARFDQEGIALVPPQNMPHKNFVDDLIFSKMQNAGVESAPLCTDEEFIRRVTLDLTGRIPSPTDVTNFLKDQNPNKRDILIDALSNSPEFVDKWTMFFADLYKSNSTANNINRFIGGSEAFYKFIHDAIEQNKSYAQMATEMITARGDSYLDGQTNFIVGGFVPMGPAQDTYDGYAVNTAQVFLGLSSMDCLLCHDGAGHLDAVNLWGSKATRADAWGMAAFFARTRRQTVAAGTNLQKYTITEATSGEYDLNTTTGNRSSRLPMGNVRSVAPKYMFGNRGVVANGEDRRTVLAKYITQDPQFARAAVNYLWEKLMVEALVSPSGTFDLARLDPDAQMPDGWVLQPNNAELLEALAQEFSNNNFNLRYIIRTIVQSSTYQLSSKYPGTWKLEYVPLYARKFARRLDAEELHDAVIKATNLPPVTNAVTINGTVVSPRMLGFPIIDEVGAKKREIQWAMQLPEPREPRFGQQNGSSANILNTFLRGNRDLNLRLGDSSILQALNMMNNDFISRRIRYVANNSSNDAGNNSDGYIAPIPGYNAEKIVSTVKRLMETQGLTNEQIIMELYLNTLSRNPRQSEIQKVLPYFTSMGKQGAIESLQWVLVNKVDFLFNY